MAGKSSNGKGGNSSASVNIEGDTSITVTQTNNVQKTVNTSSAKESSTGTVTTSTSKTSNEEPKRVDTGNKTSKRVFSREDLKALSDSITGTFKDNKDDLKDETIEQISKFLEEADKRQAERDKERRDREEKEAAERSEKEKEKAKEIEEEFKAKETAATNRAAAALNAYSAHLQKMEEEHKSTTLAEIAKAAPKAAANAAKIGGAGTAFGVEALNAVNPALGTMAQLFMSKDGLGPYFRSFFGTMKDATKDAFNNKVKEAELEEEIIESLKDSAVNVKDLLKLTADIKNIDVQKLLNAQGEDIPGMFGGGKSKTAVSDAVKKSASSDALPSVKADSTKTGGSDKAMSDAIKDSQIKQEGAFTKLTNAISTLSSSIMPKKTGSEAAHETAVKDMFGRKEGGEKEKMAKSDAWKEIFGALKQGLIATLGLLALYFSGGQFKALMWDMVASPFRSLWKSINKFIHGEFKEGFSNLGDSIWGIIKTFNIAMVGLKLLLGRFFPLGSILKLEGKALLGIGKFALTHARGLMQIANAGLAARSAFEAYQAAKLGDWGKATQKGIKSMTQAIGMIPGLWWAGPAAELAEAIGTAIGDWWADWWSSKKKEEEDKNRSEHLKKVRGNSTQIMELMKKSKKEVSLEEFVDFKSRGLTEEEMLAELKKKKGPTLSDKEIAVRSKAVELANANSIMFDLSKTVGVDALGKGASKLSEQEWDKIKKGWIKQGGKEEEFETLRTQALAYNRALAVKTTKGDDEYEKTLEVLAGVDKPNDKAKADKAKPQKTAKAEITVPKVEISKQPVGVTTTVADTSIRTNVVNKEVAPVVDTSKKVKTAEMIDSSKSTAVSTAKIQSETTNQLFERKLDELINEVQRKQTAVLNGNNLSSTIAQRV